MHTYAFYFTTQEKMPQAVTKISFPWHCGRVVTLIAQNIYTSNFSKEKQNNPSATCTAENQHMPWAFCQICKMSGCAYARNAGNVFPTNITWSRHTSRHVRYALAYITCVTRVPWYMPRSLTSVFIWSRWREKRYRHSRRKRNPQFYVSGKRPMQCLDLLSLEMYHQDPATAQPESRNTNRITVDCYSGHLRCHQQWQNRQYDNDMAPMTLCI